MDVEIQQCRVFELSCSRRLLNSYVCILEGVTKYFKNTIELLFVLLTLALFLLLVSFSSLSGQVRAGSRNLVSVLDPVCPLKEIQADHQPEAGQAAITSVVL